MAPDVIRKVRPSIFICILVVLFVIELGPTKVKTFSGSYYMIKHVLTFVSGVQESILLHFICQNKVKILHKVKTCQNCLHQKFPYKNEKTCISSKFF